MMYDVCAHVNICMHKTTCIYSIKPCTFICTCVHMYKTMYSMCVCMHKTVYMCVQVYICIRPCIYIICCMCVYKTMYVCICIRLCTFVYWCVYDMNTCGVGMFCVCRGETKRLAEECLPVQGDGKQGLWEGKLDKG